MKNKYIIYTDGSCLDNPGIGGWAFYILQNNEIKDKDSGADIDTTNNRMEITAILNALKRTPENCEIDLYSDSNYALNVCFGTWKRNLNNDLLDEIDSLKQTRIVTPHWVKGHDKNEYNNMCDEDARTQAENLKAI